MLRNFQREFPTLVADGNDNAIAMVQGVVRCPPEGLGIDDEPFRMGTADVVDFERPGCSDGHWSLVTGH